MSVSNQTVSELYVGDATQTDFAIPCAFSPAEASEQIAVFLVDSITGVMVAQQEGAALHYILDPPYNSSSNPTGPDTVIFNTAPAVGKFVWVGRDTEIRQRMTMSAAGGIPPKSLETQLDDLCLMIQEINNKHNLSIKINYIDQAADFSPELPLAVARRVLAVNAAGDGFEFLAVAADGTIIPS